MKTKNVLLTAKRHYAVLFIITSLFLLIPVVKSSAQQVNFTGTWGFNESKSTPAEGGMRFAPSKLIITHNGNDLSVQSVMQGPEGDMTMNSKYTLDGKECSNTMFMDNVRKSVVKWGSDGKTLTFNHSMSFNGNDFSYTETWKYNDADKTLAVETVMNTPNGEMRVRNVYDKK